MQLLDYQQEAVNQLLNYDNWALFLNTGSGKTITSLTLLEKQGHKDVVILCRKNKVKEWEEDTEKLNINFTILNFHNVHKLEELIDIKSGKYFILIDESQNIKTATQKSKRWNMLKKLKRYDNKFGLLSGTPQHHKYLDYYTSFFLLDIYPRTITQFKGEFCTEYQPPGQLFRIIDHSKYRNTNRLYGMLHSPNVVWYHKQHTFEPEYFDVMFKTTKLAKHIIKDRVYEDILLDTPSKLALYARTLESGIIGEYVIHKNKAVFLIDELLPLYKTAVIFTNYIKEVEVISGLLDQYGIPHNVFTGSRKDDITENVVIVNTNAGGSGMNSLADYDCAIFHSIPMKYIDMEQAIGRVNRIGQTKVPHVYFLMGPEESKKFKEHNKRRSFDDVHFGI